MTMWTYIPDEVVSNPKQILLNPKGWFSYMCWHNTQWCSILFDIWAPMFTSNPSFYNKARVLTLKLHMLNFFERLKGLCRDILLLRPRTQDTEMILLPLGKSKTKEQFFNNNFQKVVAFNSIPDALRNLHTSKAKYLTIILTTSAYGNRQNAIKFARADLLEHWNI